MKKYISAAFSLIELMIVITIIGILAAVAVPSYSDYVVRTEMAQAVVYLNDVKNRASEYYQLNGSFPPDLASINLTATTYSAPVIRQLEILPAGCPLAGSMGGSWCAFFRIYRSKSTLTHDNGALIMSASVSNGTINWNCATDLPGQVNSIPANRMPGGCIVPSS